MSILKIPILLQAGGIVGQRIIKWLALDVVFGLLPLATVLVIRHFTNRLSVIEMTNNYLELLFFAFTITISTIGDLDDASDVLKRQPLLNRSIRWFLYFTCYWLAMLYGAATLDNIINLNLSGFRYRVFWFAVTYTIIVFVVGLSVQFLVAKVEVLRKTP